MVTNTGTYIDCPFHRYADGKDFSQLELELFVDLPGIVINATDRNDLGIGLEYFTGKELKGKAVLVHTGWAKHWNTSQYYENHPFITEEAALFLRDSQVKLVGIDSHNIDDTRGKSRPAHTILLKNSIFIVEHLCHLENIPPSEFYFNALPPKLKGVGTFPVRAFAKIK
jgi:kynurenine formamidase